MIQSYSRSMMIVKSSVPDRGAGVRSRADQSCPWITHHLDDDCTDSFSQNREISASAISQKATG